MRTKKRSHARAADLCFLYLHVSQNTALYRNTERRPQQTSSSAEGFVFKLTEHKGRTDSVYCFTWLHLALTVLQCFVFFLFFFALKSTLCLTVKPTSITHSQVKPLQKREREGEIKSDTTSSSWNTFQKIIRSQQNQQQLVRNLDKVQQSPSG